MEMSKGRNRKEAVRIGRTDGRGRYIELNGWQRAPSIPYFLETARMHRGSGVLRERAEVIRGKIA